MKKSNDVTVQETAIDFTTLMPTKSIKPKSLIALKNEAVKAKIADNMTSLSQGFKGLLRAKVEIAEYIKEKGEKSPKFLGGFNVELCNKILNEKDLKAFTDTFDPIDADRKHWSGNLIKVAFYRAIGLTKPRTAESLAKYEAKKAEKAAKDAVKAA